MSELMPKVEMKDHQIVLKDCRIVDLEAQLVQYSRESTEVYCNTLIIITLVFSNNFFLQKRLRSFLKNWF